MLLEMKVILNVNVQNRFLNKPGFKFRKYRFNIRIMAELTAKLFRDYFGGSWLARITKNGEFQREIVFNWPQLSGKFSSLGTEAGLIPPGGGIIDDTKQVFVAGWRSDSHSWHCLWHNEFGGYGEMKWTSMEMKNGNLVLYGSVHECKQESDDPTEHIAMCEMFDSDHFKYTIQSERKGILEIDSRRVRTARELSVMMEAQSKKVKSLNKFV
jgi:hypothetical protein